MSTTCERLRLQRRGSQSKPYPVRLRASPTISEGGGPDAVTV
jgi:hypothetical protein